MADVCSGRNLVILHVKCLPGTGSGFIFHHNGNSGSHYQQHNIPRGLGLDNLHNISIQISIINNIPLCHLVSMSSDVSGDGGDGGEGDDGGDGGHGRVVVVTNQCLV